MTERLIRVNELIKRELSEQLHRDYREESISITIVDVDIRPDLREGLVYYSVFGGPEKVRSAIQFFKRFGKALRFKLAKSVTLKYLPHLKFFYDHSMQRGSQVIGILDNLEDNPGKSEA